MPARRLLVLLGLTIAAVAGGLISAGPPRIEPPATGGRPPKMAAPPGFPAPAAPGALMITPSPEPWYSVLLTGEVDGFIEPCG